MVQKENMSPLKFYTNFKGISLQKSLKIENILIEYAMRYGSPSIKNKISRFKRKGL